VSFSSQVKAELCQTRLDRKCCSVAEAYGALLYCNTFSPAEIRFITSSEDFAARLPRLMRRAFGLNFDILPPDAASGKRSFVMTDRNKIAAVFSAFGIDADAALSLHINLGVLENECCRASFIRGAFLAGGSVTDPGKRYHLEMSTSHLSVSREAYSILLEMGFSPKETRRSGSCLIYFKQSEAIADFLTTIGASGSAMDVMNAKVEKDMRNTVNRKVNCDSANADKTVNAAQEQLEAIRRLDREYGIENLPDTLQEAALLRITNPEASLADLARLAMPPVSKSCLSHRLKKLTTLDPAMLEPPSME
jgi:DNA-binding protein WhiA